MKKKKIRCYKVHANVRQGAFNYPVYNVVKDGWSNFSLATCTNCGELFVIDWENPATKGLNIVDMAATHLCPTCY
jgi:hypothetical protein